MVYRARQAELDRSVVIKVLINVDEETTRRRFDRERKAMGRLSQAAGIAPVYGSGFTPTGRPYLLMPFYERGSLQEQIDGGAALAPEQVRSIGVSVANAVHTAHENDVFHRDLKPANILMTRTGKVDVADFGIAHLADDALGTSQALTMTPLYTAPEVFDGAGATAAGDVYSLGATLFALLRGYPAYGDPDGATPVLSVMRRINDEPLPSLPDSVPPGLGRVVRRAMSKNPSERPANAREFARLLAAADMSGGKVATPRQEVTQDFPDSRPRRKVPKLAVALAALVLVGAGAVVAAVLVRDDKGDIASDIETIEPTVAPLITPTAVPVATSTPTAFQPAAAISSARSSRMRIEAYSCAGVNIETGVLIDDGTVATTADVLESPWYVDVSLRGKVGHVEVMTGEVAAGFGLLVLEDETVFEAERTVAVSDGERVAIVNRDGRASIASITAPAEATGLFEVDLAEGGDLDAISAVDAVMAESGALVGVVQRRGDTIEVLEPSDLRVGQPADLDFDCSPTFDRELGPGDVESVVSPAIGELLTMQQLNNAYAAGQWPQVRQFEPAKRVYTDQQFQDGWNGLRQGFVYPVNREQDSDGLSRWRIGLIGYETWNNRDITTLFCLTWTVDPVSGAVVQTNEDNVLIYGSQAGQDQRAGFIRPAALRPLILEQCPL